MKGDVTMKHKFEIVRWILAVIAGVWFGLVVYEWLGADGRTS